MGLLSLACLAAIGAGQGTVAFADAITTAASLEYQETPYSIVNWSLSSTPQSAPFKHEPAASGKTIRGVLKFGGGASNSIPFLWQRDAGKLFLDLNRNGDLTDDPAGVFSTHEGRAQTFTNVHLPFNTAAGPFQTLVNLSMWDYSGTPSFSLALRSFWQGRVALQGQDWQAGLIPNFLEQSFSLTNGYLLLRPWANRAAAFNIYDGSLDAVLFAPKVFAGGHAWQLACLANSQNGRARPSLQFTEQSVALGEVRITGKYIQRLVLPGGAYLVVLDQPAETVKIPVGSYNQPDVLLSQGGTAAYCNASTLRPPNRRISVDGKAPVTLEVGGPLTNSVSVTRARRDLRLNYQLVGAGGAVYQLVAQDRTKPPEFAVYKDGKQIASGAFEFG